MMISQFCLALNESQFIIIKMFFRSIKHHWQKFIHASTMFNVSLFPLSTYARVQKSCCSDNGTINQFDQYEKWHLELISKNIFILTLFCVMFVREFLVKLLHGLRVKYYVVSNIIFYQLIFLLCMNQ